MRGPLPARLLRAVTSGVVHDAVVTLFPTDCRLCEAPLLRGGGVPVCEGCLCRPQLQRGSLCACCGEALGMESERFVRGRGEEAFLCALCREVPPAFARAVAYGVYEGELRELIHLFKYEGMTRLAKPLGGMLAVVIRTLQRELEEGGGEWLVAPVPLARGKRRSRGYNQAELLAEAARREVVRNIPGLRLTLRPELIKRVRTTESQFGLTPHQRRANVRGAFAVADKDAVKGKRVLLIDDIYTTGATARACSEALRRAGARDVLMATLGRAQAETVALWDAVLSARDEQATR